MEGSQGEGKEGSRVVGGMPFHTETERRLCGVWRGLRPVRPCQKKLIC